MDDIHNDRITSKHVNVVTFATNLMSYKRLRSPSLAEETGFDHTSAKYKSGRLRLLLRVGVMVSQPDHVTVLKFEGRAYCEALKTIRATASKAIPFRLTYDPSDLARAITFCATLV